MTDLRLIQYFEAVYRLLSFSKAAEELRLTHSAVTRSIKTLEDSWGTQLFYRTTRSVAPTEAGERLYPMAVELLAFSETVKNETIAGDRQLKLIGGPIALDILLPKAILAFRKTSGSVRVSADIMPPMVAVEELIQRRANLVMFDTATLGSMPHANRIWFREVMVEDYVMVFRPGHRVVDAGASFESLLALPWVFPGYDRYLDAHMPDGLREVLRQADAPQYNLYSPTACMNLAQESDILSVVPMSLAAPYLATGRLVGRLMRAIPRYRIGAAMLKETRLEPNITAFMDSLDVAAREIERLSEIQAAFLN